jgi:HSP20 family protein
MRLVRYTLPFPTRRSSALAGGIRSPWSGLEDEIDRMFAAAFDGGTPSASPGFPADLFEDQANTYVRAELPGLSREEIAVELAEGELTLTVTRRPPANAAPAETGGAPAPAPQPFRRTVGISAPVDAAKVSATFEHGILTVTLPKPATAAPRKITVAVN